MCPAQGLQPQVPQSLRAEYQPGLMGDEMPFPRLRPVWVAAVPHCAACPRAAAVLEPLLACPSLLP